MVCWLMLVFDHSPYDAAASQLRFGTYDAMATMPQQLPRSLPIVRTHANTAVRRLLPAFGHGVAVHQPLPDDAAMVPRYTSRSPCSYDAA
jgi:hypothetical protein